MPIPNERVDQDAPASIETQYCFVPNADGSYDKDNNTFKGTFSHGGDEDWILIELKAGQAYRITLDGHKRDNGSENADENYNPAGDVVMAIYDSKGTLIRTYDENNNDEKSGGAEVATLSSLFTEAGGQYYISVKPNNDNPGTDNSGDYIITVKKLNCRPISWVRHWAICSRVKTTLERRSSVWAVMTGCWAGVAMTTWTAATVTTCS